MPRKPKLADQFSSGEAPLRLTAVTLRGIGPYYRGARLDLRPITVLCGANGSGKSTWFRVLRDLRGFDLRDYEELASMSDGRFHGAFNALMAETGYDRLVDPAPTDAEAGFGPPGTIGLEFVAARDAVVGEPLDAAEIAESFGPLQRPGFLATGAIPAGTKGLLQVSLPHRIDEGIGDAASPWLTCSGVRIRVVVTGLGELILNGDQHWDLEIRGALVDLERNDDTYEDTPHWSAFEKYKPESPEEGWQAAGARLRVVVGRLHELIEAVLRGVFHVEAIRPLETRTKVSRAEGLGDSWDKPRWVGSGGARAHVVAERFAGASMLEHSAPAYGRLDATLRAEDVLVPLRMVAMLGAAKKRSGLARVRGRIGPSSWSELQWGAQEARGTEDTHGLSRLVADALNEVLEDRGLVPERRPPRVEDAVARKLMKLDRTSLAAADVRWINRRYVEHLFRTSRAALVREAPKYTLDVFVDWWLTELVKTHRIATPRARTRPGDLWRGQGDGPKGVLLADPGAFEASPPGAEDIAIERYWNTDFGTSGLPALPASLSAGFHQVFPIVVQAGVLQPGEVMLLENPEVHLHPGLQLHLTNFLLEMGKSGRTIVIETHSDLVIRRLLRAVLEEQVTQSAVSINFASKSDRGDGATTSRLEGLRVNERGQVANWPEGFLTDSIRESERLLDAMYGADAPIDDEDSQ